MTSTVGDWPLSPGYCLRQTVNTHVKYVYRARDIFDVARAKILKIECEPLTDRVTRCPTDIDSAGRGDAFQSGSNVDAVAEYVFPFSKYVAKVDADPQIQSSIFRQIEITC